VNLLGLSLELIQDFRPGSERKAPSHNVRHRITSRADPGTQPDRRRAVGLPPSSEGAAAAGGLSQPESPLAPTEPASQIQEVAADSGVKQGRDCLPVNSRRGSGICWTVMYEHV
jgi:hypothetical protein